MKVGYQGEERSYSHRAVADLFPGADPVGLACFADAFTALAAGAVDRLVVPIENSTTGSILEVLDRLAAADASIIAEHYGRVRHALVGMPEAKPTDVRQVLSHPEALAQARDTLSVRGWEPVPVADTAGAVRLVAERRDPTVAALAPPDAHLRFGLRVLLSDVMDRDHNATRFVALAPGPPTVEPDHDKASLSFSTAHTPGALALALTELGLRGANLTRIESRPGTSAWSYRFYVDLVHEAGRRGLSKILDPQPASLKDLTLLGSYRAA